MSKQLIVERILAVLKRNGWQEPTIIKYEEGTVWSFDITGHLDRSIWINTQQHVKENGWRTPLPRPYQSTEVPEFMRSTHVPTAGILTHVSIAYRHEKDTISITERKFGIAWNSIKKRYYPSKRIVNKLSYTPKGLWTFGQKDRKPRVLMGGNAAHTGRVEDYVDWAVKEILEINYDWQGFKASWKHFLNTRNEFDFLEKKYGVRLPKAFRALSTFDMCKAAEIINPQDFNRLCQIISAHNWHQERKVSLDHLLTRAMGITDNHMIRDWMDDHLHFKQKLNLKINSIKRLQEEHRRMSYARSLEKFEVVTPHEKYWDILSQIDPSVKVELIMTKERLLDETVKMAHCVATYGAKINRGDAAIFHIEYLGVPYTLEVSEINLPLYTTATGTKHLGFYRQQIRGFANDVGCDGPPQSLKNAIDITLELYNEKLRLRKQLSSEVKSERVLNDPLLNEPEHQL